MKNKIIICLLMVGCAVALVSCGSSKPKTLPFRGGTLNLDLVTAANNNRFVNLDYGIRLNVGDHRSSSSLLGKYDASATYKPLFKANPEVRSFVEESTRRYMRSMGFNLDADVETDYMMSLRIQEFSVSYLSGLGWSGTVQLGVDVQDHNQQLVYPNVVATGRFSCDGASNDLRSATAAINKAYANALQDIDWDRIAFFLKRHSSPSQEKNKKVEGEGSTALEATVIRWYIDSTPKGADVSWRVVSSTSAVKNTNSNYVGSTPYETTESFDIKGLTYNNSGDVQIEVTCEKAGYVTQKKRFNVRQALDQKEISTKFNMVKDE